MSNFPSPTFLYNSCNQIMRICKDASKSGLMPGYSGNASIRITKGLILITGHDKPKGHLKASDLVFMSTSGKPIAGECRPSIERFLHALIYELFPGYNAILHTHPPKMLALELLLKERWEREAFDLPEHWAQLWRDTIVFADPTEPGSQKEVDEARFCIRATWSPGQQKPRALWLGKHGLVTFSYSLLDALAICGAYENIASIQLTLMQERLGTRIGI